MMPVSKHMRKRAKRSTKTQKLLPSHLIPTQTSIMAALPNEIWCEVLSYLCKKDLKLLRLVGDRLLESLASPQLFRTAYIAARRGVLDIFLKVTTHDTIRHYIQEVIYDGSWLDPPAGVIQTRSTRNGSYRITSACTDLPLAKLFQEQEIIREKELQQALKTAFGTLTAVKRVVFADLSRTAGLVGDSLDSNGEPLGHRTSSVFDPSSVSNPSSSGHSVSNGFDQGQFALEKEACRRQYDGLSMLLQTLSSYAPTTLSELSLGDGRQSSDNINNATFRPYVGCSFGGIPDWYFAPMPSHSLDRSLYGVFQRLRKLDLTVSFPVDDKNKNSTKCPVAENYAHLGELLDVADELEELRLCGHIDTGSLDFEHVFTRRTWSRLRSLELRYCEGTFLGLKDMFTCQQYTLRSITLDFFNLTGGSWSSLIAFVKAELPETSFTLGWLWQDEIPAVVEEDGDDEDYVGGSEREQAQSNDAESASQAENASNGDKTLDAENALDAESSSEDELEYESGSGKSGE